MKQKSYYLWILSIAVLLQGVYTAAAPEKEKTLRQMRKQKRQLQEKSEPLLQIKHPYRFAAGLACLGASYYLSKKEPISDIVDIVGATLAISACQGVLVDHRTKELIWHVSWGIGLIAACNKLPRGTPIFKNNSALVKNAGFMALHIGLQPMYERIWNNVCQGADYAYHDLAGFKRQAPDTFDDFDNFDI